MRSARSRCRSVRVARRSSDLVEHLQVLGRYEHVFPAVEVQFQGALAGQFDDQLGPVVQGQVELHGAAQGGQSADPGGPGRAAVAALGDVEVVGADVDRDRPVGAGQLLGSGRSSSWSMPSTVSTRRMFTDPRNSVTNGVAGFS